MRTTVRISVLALLCVTVAVAAAPTSSPVADAAMRRDTDALRTSLQQGADVNAAQGDGMSALHWAAEHGDAALTDMLVYAGANVSAVTRPVMLDVRSACVVEAEDVPSGRETVRLVVSQRCWSSS